MNAPTAWLESQDGRTWPIAERGSIGRAQTNDIVIDDDKVSRNHALIHKQEASEYWIVDLGSGNGTYINGRRLALATRLTDGDKLTLGTVVLSFRRQATGAVEATRPAETQTVLNVRNERCWLLVVDIKSSTALAARLPPTDFALTVGKWMAACRTIVESNGGTINKYLGDGFFAYWTCDANRTAAVAAALTKFRALQQDGSSPPFRVVLHQGPVAMGAGGALSEDSLSGMDVIAVFRMERLASTLGSDVLLSDATEALLSPVLPLAEIGTHAIPGLDGARRKFFAVR